MLLKEEFAFYLQQLSSLKLMNIVCLMLMNCWLTELMSHHLASWFSVEKENKQGIHIHVQLFPYFASSKLRIWMQILVIDQSINQVSYCSLSLRILFSFSNNNRQCGISGERPHILQAVNTNITWTTKIDWICVWTIPKFMVHTYISMKMKFLHLDIGITCADH